MDEGPNPVDTFRQDRSSHSFQPHPHPTFYGNPQQTPAHSTFLNATAGLLAFYQNCNPQFRFLQSVPRRCLTKPSHPMYNDDFDNSSHDYILHVNDTLADGDSDEFTVLDLLGTGTFGQVVKCRHKGTGNVVAVKVIKNHPAYFNQAWVEINILRMLYRNNNSVDTSHIVKFYSHFTFRGHLCLVFEELSINLYELLKQNNYTGVSLDTLRTFLTQILQVLNVLRRSEVIHCDLKPENILLKKFDSADLKIIDFGSACQLHYPVYSYVQSRFYRSPEVLLGLPEYDTKIDMWSLGCVAGELFLGIPLFPGQNEMNMIARIIEMIGEMPDRFLRRCRHTNKFFAHSQRSEVSDDMHVYKLKSISQFEQENGVTLSEWKKFFKEKKLRDIVMTYPHRTLQPYSEEIALRESLIDLLNGMLKIDPKDRWTPSEALEHPFIKGIALPDGQPWQPPSRPRRVMRSRPVHIEVADEDEPAPTDGMYSASAPNFTSKGHLEMNSTWGSGAGGQAPGVANNGVLQPPHFLPPPPNYDRIDTGNEKGIEGDVFAPGSYIPSSTLSMYGSNLVGRNGERAVGMKGNINQHEVERASHMGAVTNKEWTMRNMMPSLSSALINCDSPSRRGGKLPTSGSHDTLSESLHMSDSRESLGTVKDSCMGDMNVEPMFSFGSDDEASPRESTINLCTDAGAITSETSFSNSWSGNTASAALPPPGPRLSHGRSGCALKNQTRTLQRDDDVAEQ